jgi:hypothetical protein
MKKRPGAPQGSPGPEKNCLFLYESYDTADAGFSAFETPGEASDGGSLTGKKINISSKALRMDNVVGEEIHVHELVVFGGEKVIQPLAVFLFEMLIRTCSLVRHPLPNLGVHGMIRGAAVYPDPLDLPLLAPLGKLVGGAGVLDHVADLICLGLIPSVAVIAGVDDEDIPVVYLRPFFDILAGVDAVVFGDIRKIHHHPGAYEEVLQLQAGDIASVSAEVERSVEMGSHMVGVGKKLSVGTVRGETLEEFDLQRLVGGPGRGKVAERNGEIVNLEAFPIFKFPVCAHDSCSSSKSLYCVVFDGLRDYCSGVPR